MQYPARATPMAPDGSIGFGATGQPLVEVRPLWRASNGSRTATAGNLRWLVLRPHHSMPSQATRRGQASCGPFSGPLHISSRALSFSNSVASLSQTLAKSLNSIRPWTLVVSRPSENIRPRADDILGDHRGTWLPPPRFFRRE